MTEATPLASEQITQEDRALYLALGIFHTCEDRMILAGLADETPEMQRIARHRIAALSASPAPSGQGVSGEPVAWSYDLATSIGGDGTYSRFDRRIGFSKPNVPEGAARNLTPLYAAPAPSCASGEVERWQTGRDIPKVEQRHKDAAAWAMDRSPDGLTWDNATAAHVTPDRRWQMNRVAEAMARIERAALSPQGLDATQQENDR